MLARAPDLSPTEVRALEHIAKAPAVVDVRDHILARLRTRGLTAMQGSRLALTPLGREALARAKR